MISPYTYSGITRFFNHVLTIVTIAIPLAISYLRSSDPTLLAEAGVITSRQTDSTCKRWAQQSAIINGTLYLQGGQASTDPTQTQNTWNNDFLALDLTKTWQITQPSLSSLPHPSDLPPVALGSLWSSHDSLFLYGGEYSWKPAVSPSPFALWQYNVPAKTWTSYPAPSATAGPNSEAGPVQRAAEGAGVSAPGLGRGWYFGGHIDGYTTAGWSQSIPRIYIKSLLEFTFPGSPNPLSNNSPAPSSGSFRNITQGGAQESSGFPERADGALVYVPNIGESGILVGLAGGTENTFSQLNIVDVYDIDKSTWARQSTAGPTPKIRVNPCTVAAVAPDGTSVNIYFFGGQALQPPGSQEQYSDMWILTLPAFRWIPINTDGQSVPPARSGHTCKIWDGQMVVVGGYVGNELSCDSPGVYTFNLTSLTWTENFTPLSDPQENPQSKQSGQVNDPNALQGSYGYDVPDPVQKQVGGGPSGGATVTVPVAVPSSGPLASGKPKTYTVPGATATTTAAPGSGDGSLNSGAKIAIGVGIVAGFLLIVVIYLAICAWLYRKRMRLYQWNMERAKTQLTQQRASVDNGPNAHGYFGDGISPSSGLTGSSGTGVEKEEAAAAAEKRRHSSQDLLSGQEPSFVGIMLHPRRSLRVVNP